MQEDIQNTLEEYFLNLPPEIKNRVEGNWGNTLLEQLNRNRVPNQYSERIEDEVFLNIAGIQTPEEVCASIKEILPLDSNSLSALCSDLKEKVLVRDAPTQIDTSTESQAGVDIIPKEKEPISQETTLGRNSLIKSIEHPEESKKIEEEAKQRVPINPITSKLNSSTLGTGGTTMPQSSSYENDPYREPTS